MVAKTDLLQSSVSGPIFDNLKDSNTINFSIPLEWLDTNQAAQYLGNISGCTQKYDQQR